MELSKEFIEENKLSDDQVTAITDFGKGQVAELQKQWDTKANDNAQKILDGVVSSTHEKTGFKLERNQGEKHADYLVRYSTSFLESKKSEVDSLKADYEQKLKDFKGGDALQSELDAARSKLDEAMKKYADYDDLKEKAAKAEEYGKELSGLKLEVAFNGVRPNFPDTVNPYEAKAKWEDFKKSVLEKNKIELVDGEPMVVDKENQYKTSKLSDLVTKDETLQALLKGREQKGPGGEPVDLEEIEGVPFKVPKDADAVTRSKLIKEQLAKDGIGGTHPDYAKKFGELNKKILEAKKAA